MIHQLKLAIVLLFVGHTAFSQSKLPIIKATSKKVDIRDGANFKKGYWNISPATKPDVYQTNSINKRITFYTDQDSISFKVKPNHTYNFIILLNNKDSALTQIVYMPSYLDVLKKAAQYNFNDQRVLTNFTYRSQNDPDLIELRKTFKLDSIVGTGNEVSKILSLLHWVHNTFPHDGSKEIPKYTSISNLMSISLKEHTTFHCGALAWVMNDCCLALGFKSRHVVCLPKDSTDFDCHSINTVYSTTLNKWLWIDPTNDAYVMNEEGELLSIAEVRERLINGKPLILNPEANWNHVNSITKSYYLGYYMAKNLYAFQCFVVDGGESRSNLLLPVEYKGIIPRTAMNKPKVTNNPNVFWAKPE